MILVKPLLYEDSHQPKGLIDNDLNLNVITSFY